METQLLPFWGCCTHLYKESVPFVTSHRADFQIRAFQAHGFWTSRAERKQLGAQPESLRSIYFYVSLHLVVMALF